MEHVIEYDVAVVGGGLVGCAVALGLCKRGKNVCIIDEGDRAFRASRGNFGMVWVQGKGSGFTPYANLTLQAARSWTAFDAMLHDVIGSGSDFAQCGGLGFCLSDNELSVKASVMEQLNRDAGGTFPYEMRSAAELRRELPWLGRQVAGAVFCPLDGGANPLNLLFAMQLALTQAQARFLTGHAARRISPSPTGGFVIETDLQAVRAEKVVMAAGLGNARLGDEIGLSAPVRPVRGQILVTERIPRLMRYVSNIFRQMQEGGCLIGDTVEEVGFDEGVTRDALAMLAARVTKVCPRLTDVNVVRSWGALRVMTPDGLPIYEQSESCPGAWLATVHSGVTLAPIHAGLLASAVDTGVLPELLRPFSISRFDQVQLPDQMTSH